MPIDIRNEELCTLGQASSLLPSINGRRVSANAIWRWCRKGVSGIHLEHVRIGGRIFTSSDALNRFVNRLAEQDMERLRDVTPPRPKVRARRRPRVRTSAEASRLHAEAEAELEREGL